MLLAHLKGEILESLKQLAQSLDWTMGDGEQSQELKDMIAAKQAEFETLIAGTESIFGERVTVEQEAGDSAARDARQALEDEIGETRDTLAEAWRLAGESFETQITSAKESLDEVIDNATKAIDDFLRQRLEQKWNY